MTLKDFDVLLMYPPNTLWTEAQTQNVATLVATLTGNTCKSWKLFLNTDNETTIQSHHILLISKKPTSRDHIAWSATPLSLDELNRDKDPSGLVQTKLNHAFQAAIKDMEAAQKVALQEA